MRIYVTILAQRLDQAAVAEPDVTHAKLLADASVEIDSLTRQMATLTERTVDPLKTVLESRETKPMTATEIQDRRALSDSEPTYSVSQPLIDRIHEILQQKCIRISPRPELLVRSFLAVALAQMVTSTTFVNSKE